MKKSIIIVMVFLISSLGYSQSKEKIKGDRAVVTVSKDLDKKFNAVKWPIILQFPSPGKIKTVMI